MTLTKKNICSLIGTAILMGMLAPMSVRAAGPVIGHMSKDLEDLREEAEKKMKSECKKSKELPDGDEKCIKPYKSTIDAIKDNERKSNSLAGKVGATGAKASESCPNGASKCDAGASTTNDSAMKAKQDQQKANQGLASWLRDTASQAAQKAQELRSSPNQDSGVSEAIAEHEKAQQFAEKAADKLDAEAAKDGKQANEFANEKSATDKNANSLNSTPAGKSDQAKSSDATKPAEAGGAGAGGAPNIPSPPSSGAGEGNPASAPSSSSAMDGQGSLSPGNGIAKNSFGGAKSAANDLKLDTTPKKDPAAVIAADGSTNSTSSSKLDTSLRDSLKKKLLGDSASSSGSGDSIGGLPFGGGGSENKKGNTAAANIAGLSLSGGGGGTGGESGSGGSAESGGDFSMARSETDAAVKNLINEFSGPGGNNGDGRNLADIENGALSGIEGANGGNLFLRVRGTIIRHIQNGDVTNGVNGKI